MRRVERSVTGLLLVLVSSVTSVSTLTAEEDGAGIDFDRQVAPLFVLRCLSCHQGDDGEGSFDLSSRSTAMRGGQSGTVITAGDAENSLLWQYVESDTMPPKKPLSTDEKSLLKRWISGGAVWGSEVIDAFRFTTDSRAGVDWWSLQPLRTVVPPSTVAASSRSADANPIGNETDRITNEIDLFVLERLHAAGLNPSPQADRRTLIRRLSFDLLGLPPTPEDVQAFLADDGDGAWERLVDRYLSSPHYGERWARHWLDVARFGESNGFEYDEPRDHFWHYRNWVIDALNADLPYDEFARLQIAGDVISPEDPDAVAAAGFLVAGPHNTTLPSNDLMRRAMAQDELEDLVGTTGQTFLGLTINCARCHDHKFDPVSQKDYYQFAASLAGVRHGEHKVRVPLTGEQQQRLTEIERLLPIVQQELADLERTAIMAFRTDHDGEAATRSVPPQPWAAWDFDKGVDDRIHGLIGTLHGSAGIDQGALLVNGVDGFLSTMPLPVPVAEKTLEAWVQLDRPDQAGGAVISLQTLDGSVFDAIVYGEREPAAWMAGSNNFLRTQSFQGDPEQDALKRPVHVAIVYHNDGLIEAYRDGKRYGKSYRPRELQMFEAEKAQLVFGLRHSPPGGNRMLSGRIFRARLYTRALTAEELASSAASPETPVMGREELLARMSPVQREGHMELSQRISALTAERQALQQAETRTIYSCRAEAQPGMTHVLRRGDVTTPAEIVSPAGVNALGGSDTDFGLLPSASDADRRERLAAWITSRDNPLFSRVLVNRIWHYHFGTGIVASTNDFGFNGSAPSHPELLDWLAGWFRDSGFRMKRLHRLIVTSSTYRQSSAPNSAAMLADADNRLLWRKNPLRLDAESLRDAVLVVTGKLNRSVGGRGYRDVEHSKFGGSHFYGLKDESEFPEYRRTIYRFVPRGGRNPFLDTFDCPDPSATAPQRAVTVTPLQALSLMNNSLMFSMADEFARRAEREMNGDSTLDQQIQFLYLAAFARAASADEITEGVDFAEAYGLPAFCRVMLNSNEFLFIR